MTIGSQVRQCYATIKQIEATLQQLSVKTVDVQAKQAYQEASELIGKTKQQLQSQVTFIQIEENQYKQ